MLRDRVPGVEVACANLGAEGTAALQDRIQRFANNFGTCVAEKLFRRCIPGTNFALLVHTEGGIGCLLEEFKQFALQHNEVPY
jgi:hypothetical protein